MADAQKIEKLKEYFQKRDDVLLAFVFGSRAKGYARLISDWDIGVYFKPEDSRRIELETQREYPAEHQIWGDVARIVEAEVDLVVLNRAAPPLVFSVLNRGLPLAVKDRTLYVELLSRTHYEAVDFWKFTEDFALIRNRARSLSEEDRSNLNKHIVFLQNELEDLDKFQKVSQQQYMHERDVKRSIERWVENMVMASLDVAKIVLASEKKDIPESYRETLRVFGLLYFDEATAAVLADFADLRNIVVHEYFDLRWKRIQRFIERAKTLYPKFIARIKEIADK